MPDPQVAAAASGSRPDGAGPDGHAGWQRGGSVELPGERVVRLLGGLAPAGAPPVTTATVRPLDGDDESWLAAQPPDVAAGVVVAGLLGRTVVRLGPGQPPSLDTLLALPIADRDLLLLAVRTATYGDRFDVVLSCASCGEPMDVAFSAGDIPRRAWLEPSQPVVRRLTDGNGGSVEVSLRPPTCGDAVAVATAHSDGDPHDPVTLLARRCLVRSDGGPGGDQGWSRLPDAARAALAEVLDDVGPALELAMDLTCPECGVVFEADRDLAGYLLEELAAPAGTVLRDLHLLAGAYHWSERDIMRLPSPRRRALAALVSQDLRAAQGLP